MLQGLVAAVTPLVLMINGSSTTPIVAGQTPPTWLHGQFTNGADVEMVPYPAGFWPLQGTAHLGPSVVAGVTNTLAMQNTALAAGIPLTIMATSQGALIADQVIADDMAAGVSGDAVKFVIIEDPDGGRGALRYLRGITLPIWDYTPISVPDSPYDITRVTVEYDGVADFPDHPLNLLADINALLGLNFLHSPSVFHDLSTVPPANITIKTNAAGGVTTNYLVPTSVMPIGLELRQLGVPEPIVDFVNQILRPIIDSAYNGRLKMDAENAKAAEIASSATAMAATSAPTSIATTPPKPDITNKTVTKTPTAASAAAADKPGKKNRKPADNKTKVATAAVSAAQQNPGAAPTKPGTATRRTHD